MSESWVVVVLYVFCWQVEARGFLAMESKNASLVSLSKSDFDKFLKCRKDYGDMKAVNSQIACVVHILQWLWAFSCILELRKRLHVHNCFTCLPLCFQFEEKCKLTLNLKKRLQGGINAINRLSCFHVLPDILLFKSVDISHLFSMILLYSTVSYQRFCSSECLPVCPFAWLVSRLEMSIS